MVSALSTTLHSKYCVSSTFVSLEPPSAPLPASIDPLILHYHIDVTSASLRLDSLLPSFDLVICHYWNHPLLSFLLTTYSFCNIPLIFWTHTSGLHSLNPIPPQLLTSSVQTIYSSTASFSLPYSLTQPPINLPISIHSTRDLADFSALYKVRKYSQSPRTLLYAGTVSRHKMHSDSINIFKTLSYSYNILVVGEPTDRELFTALSTLDRIKFLGYQNSIAKYLLEADCLVYPLNNNHYGTGEQILLEALSSGLPAICIDNPAERAIVRHLFSGLLCPDSTNFISSVLELMSKPRLIQSYSLKAHLDAKERFSLSVTADKFYRAMTRLMESSIRCNGTIFRACHSDLAFSSMISATFPAHEPILETTHHSILQQITNLYLSMHIHANILSHPSKGSPFQYVSYFPNSSYISKICSRL